MAAAAARRLFQRALQMLKVTPSEVVTDAAPVYPAVLDDLIPSAWHHVELGLDSQPKLRIASAFSDLARVI